MTFPLSNEPRHINTLVTGRVVPEAELCIQCGICSFNCPINIDVRLYAWMGEYVEDSHCLTCGECVERCPRNVLHFERTGLFAEEKE
jgi:ferredoxin